jgi:hypothetical protein
MMKNQKRSENMRRRWAAGDPCLKPPNPPIVWTEDLNAALAKLVARFPPLSWEALGEAMGFDHDTCKKQAIKLGLRKANANRRLRVNRGLPPDKEVRWRELQRKLAAQKAG